MILMLILLLRVYMQAIGLVCLTRFSVGRGLYYTVWRSGWWFMMFIVTYDINQYVILIVTFVVFDQFY